MEDLALDRVSTQHTHQHVHEGHKPLSGLVVKGTRSDGPVQLEGLKASVPYTNSRVPR